MRTLATLLLAFCLMGVALTAAQDSSQKALLPAFDVVSVRHNTSGDNISYPPRWTPGRMAATNVRLDFLVLEAFGIPMQLAHQFVVGGLHREVSCMRDCRSRDEVLGARFDIQATLPEGLTTAQQRAILRRFLEER